MLRRLFLLHIRLEEGLQPVTPELKWPTKNPRQTCTSSNEWSESKSNLAVSVPSSLDRVLSGTLEKCGADPCQRLEILVQIQGRRTYCNAQLLCHFCRYLACRFSMASEQKKRARPVPKASQRSKKRQKIDPVKNGPATVEKRAVALDALPWNEVEMPDMFEDAEGFFGLEEVEGVEVIREGDTVKFVCVNARQKINDLLSLGDCCLPNGRGRG